MYLTQERLASERWNILQLTLIESALRAVGCKQLCELGKDRHESHRFSLFLGC
jgi:hypothetical protein